MDLFTPFQFAFMQNALLICVLVAVPTAMMSCFLVLRGWALMGDAVSHAVLPGIVLAYIAGLPLLLGAFASGMACALATGYLAENSRVKRDTVMGVVFSGMFAFGIVLYAWVDTDVHLDHILFGNILGVSSTDLWTAGVISAAVSLGLALFWKDLLLLSFDPAQARASGLAVSFLHYGLLAALALTIIATLTAAGLILAIGLVIAPGAIAFLVVRRFGAMLVVAVAVNIVTMVLGVYLSFWIDSAPAPTIILVQAIVFTVAFIRQILTNRMAEQQVVTTD